MRVLVTNDDGIHRPGLRRLVWEIATHGHEVHVLAPAGERSGSSASLGTVTREGYIGLRRVVLKGLSEVVAHALDAPPALAVRAACTGAFGWVPDLVVSGVNPGFNTGRLVVHSGTVGAALTAASLDTVGIAVSSRDEGVRGVGQAAQMAGWLIDLVVASQIPPMALNLNVPALPPQRLGGVRGAGFSETSTHDLAFEAGSDCLCYRRRTNDAGFVKDTDADLLRRGFAVLSAVSLPWTGAPDIGSLARELNDRTGSWQLASSVPDPAYGDADASQSSSTPPSTGTP